MERALKPAALIRLLLDIGFGSPQFIEENWLTSAVDGAVVPPTNQAPISALYAYDRYSTGEDEYFDLLRDPYELASKQVSATRKEKQDGLWTRLRDCRGAECVSAEGG